MTKELAIRQLNIGYILAVIGFFAGLFLTDELKLNLIFSGMFTAYAFWGSYWGFRIVKQPISNFFSEITIFETSISKAIVTHILLKMITYAVIAISSYTVGLIGGGIYKQVNLMRVK